MTHANTTTPRTRPRPPLAAAILATATAAHTLITAAGCEREAIRLRADDGIRIQDINAGSGYPAREGSTVTVHYTGALPNGTVIIDTRKNRQSHTFTIGDGTVIPGMDQGVLGMREGGSRRITMPPVTHYGMNGYADVVPPATTLTFNVELLELRW